MVNNSIRSLLNPELTASWEKGLTYVAEGTITSEEYMEKLEGFIKEEPMPYLAATVPMLCGNCLTNRQFSIKNSKAAEAINRR